MGSTTKIAGKAPRVLLTSMLVVSLVPVAPSTAHAEEAAGQSIEIESAIEPNLGTEGAIGLNADVGNTSAQGLETRVAATQAATVQATDWKACGTCEWMVDDAGCLVIRPAGGAESGELAAWGSTPPWYQSKGSIVSVRFEGKVYAPSAYRMFYDCSKLESINLSGLDFSKTTDISYLFYGCESLKSTDLSGLDTSNVTDMSVMFSGCTKLESVNLTGFNTSKATNMSGMFASCSSLKSLNLSSFNTSSATSMASMFYGCSKLESIDLSSFNTSKVASISYMFYNCSYLSSLELASFNTSNVTDMGRAFYRCSKLESLDLSGFDTSNTTSMIEMFRGCSSLKSINLSGFDTSKVTKMSGMFYGCSNLASLDLSGFDTSSEPTMSNMFYGCSAVRSVKVGDKYAGALPVPEGNGATGLWVDIDTGAAYAPDAIPEGKAASYEAQTLAAGWSACGSCEWRVDDVGYLTVRPAGGATSGQMVEWGSTPPWYQSKDPIVYARFEGKVYAPADASRMFSDCPQLEAADLSNLDTSNVTNMSGMFSDCPKLVLLDLSGFDTSKVEAADGMFEGCGAVRSVKVGDKYAGPFPVPEGVDVTGLWEDASTGEAYAPDAVPGRRAASYEAQLAPTVRLGGETRVDTMALIAQQGFPEDHACNRILLATAYNYADALSASALAGAFGAPLVTTSGTSLDEAARAEIERLADGTATVYVVGGEAAVSGEVAAAAADVPGVAAVKRLYGDSRVETGSAIYEAGEGLWSATCVVANAWNYADALGAGAFCATNHAPLFGATDGMLTDEQVSLIRSGGFNRVVVVGGSAAVDADAVRAQLGDAFEFLVVAGDTRVETSRLLAEWSCGLVPNAAFQPEVPLSLDRFSAANAWNYADALAAVNLSERFWAPVLLVDGTDAGRASVSAVVGAHKSEIRSAWVLGGTAAVPAEVEEWIREALS